jgi:hypothetical protein
MTVMATKQYRSVVVRSKPERRVFIISVAAVLTLFVAALAYWLGGLGLRHEFNQLSAEHRQAINQLKGLEEEHLEVSQQLANMSVGLKIDQQASVGLKTLVAGHRKKINDLTEEISFYKGLMAPTEQERGLSIRSWEVTAGSDSRHFGYKLVLQQLVLKHTVLKGGVEVNVAGKLWGQPQSYALSTLVINGGAAAKLRFKYFQALEGELEIPKGFVPERVFVVAKAAVPKKARVEKQYNWAVQAGMPKS